MKRHVKPKRSRTANGPPSTATPSSPVPAAAVAPPKTPLIVGTEKWDRLNHRRGELIFKQIRQGLTPQEEEEFQQLQRMCLAALEKAFPAPPLDEARLKRLEEKLRAAEASP